MNIATPSIIVITGVMASGKSTVAQALAERLPNSVHLRGDVFRRMIVNGEAKISPRCLKKRRRNCNCAINWPLPPHGVIVRRALQ